MGYDDVVRDREMGSNTIVKGNIDENVSIRPILLKIETFVKCSGENCDKYENSYYQCIVGNILKGYD